MKKYFLLLIVLLLFVSGCAQTNYPQVTREDKIPINATKMTPETDIYPPILHSDEYEKPVPFDAINSAGAEDSPFIPNNRKEIYFFFTPDVSVPVEKQILDDVTGIWMSKYENNEWQKSERVWLQSPGKLAGDGCEFVEGDMILFCSVREGYTGIHWFSAEYENGKWTNWKNADFKSEYDVGELHIHEDELYYHSSRPGSKGKLDIWMLKKVNGEWQDPINVEAVNSEDDEGWPYISQEGKELWFTRTYQGSPAVFMSKRINDEWQAPELIVSQFAGEPTLDWNGNLYFVHHYYNNSKMIEADIYIAYKK